MAFEGDLSKVPLGDVCQTLVMTRQHGILVVRGPEQRRVSVDDRGIALVGARASMGERVARYLLATGGLDIEGLAAAEKVLRRRRNARLDEVLQSEGLVPADVLRAARAYVAQEEIFEMFLWREGTFALLEGRREEGGPFSEIAFDIGGIAMEAARRIDESTALDENVPLSAVVAPGEAAAAPRPDADGEAACRIFELIDAVDSVQEIVLTSHLGEFDTRKTLEYLLQAGALRHAATDEIREAAEAALGRDHRRALALYSRLTELAPGDESVWEGCADAHRLAGERVEAASCLVTVARLRSEQDKTHGVVDALKKARDLAPEVPHVHEYMVDALLTYGDADGAVKAARAGIARCAEAGAHETVDRIALRALEHAPDDATILVGHAATLQALGRTADAIRQYDTAAIVLARSKRDRDRLADVLRRLIRIAPDSKEYEKRLAEVQRAKNVQRRRLQLVALGVGAVLVMAGVAVPLSLRESAADRMLRVHALIDAGNFDAAEELMAEIAASNPGEETELQLRVLRGLAQRAKSGETAAHGLAARVQDANEALWSRRTTLMEDYRFSQALDLLSEMREQLNTGEGAELREDWPERHAVLREDFARDANSVVREIRDKARSAAAEAEEDAKRFRLSPAFQRARLKVDAGDEDELARLVSDTEELASRYRGTDWESIPAKIRALAEQAPSLDLAPLQAIEDNIAAFLGTAESVVRDRGLAEAYARKIRIFREFRDARTRGLELAREGRFEEALDLQERFLQTCRAVANDTDGGEARDVLLSYLESMPLEDEIRTTRNELLAAIDKERKALTAATSGRDEEAFALLIALVRSHPTLGFTGRFTLPLALRTSPPGAEIVLAETGEVVGHTPARIEYAAEGETTFRLRAPGYEDKEVVRKGARMDDSHVLDVVLQKKTRWRTSARAAIESRAALDASHVYVASRDGLVRAYSRIDGADEGSFRSELIGGFAAAPAVHDGHVFVTTVEGVGFVLRAGTLAKVSRFDVGRGVRHDLVATPHGVLVADGTGGLTLVNVRGATVWKQSVGTLAGAPVPSAVGIGVLTTSGEALVVDPLRGTIVRRIPLGAPTACEPPAVRGSTLYAATHDGAVVAVDLAGGRTIWRREVSAQMRGRPAPLAAGVAWIGNDDNVHVFDRSAGSPLRVLPLGEPAVGDLGLLDGDLLVAGTEGAVRRLRGDGSLVWSLDTETPLLVVPASGHDAVVVTGRGGLVLETGP